LVFLAALLQMPKTLEPIKDAQEPTALEPYQQALEPVELQPELQVSYPRQRRPVQAPSPHPPSRWIVQDPTVHTAPKTPHRRHPTK
jgi:hypothetical protein